MDAARLLRLSRRELKVAAELLGLRRVASHRTEGRARPAPIPPATPAEASRPVQPVDAPAPIPRHLRALPVSITERPAEPALAPVEPRPLAELLPEGREPAPPTESLFAGSTRRALLRGVTAVRAPQGDLDIEAAVRLLAANRTLDEIPLEWIETTHGQVQLLLDVGTSMDPYREDVDRLPNELIRIVGPDELELRWFQDCPLGPSGVLEPEALDPVAYTPPTTHTRLVAVTAFGAQGPVAPPPEIVAGWRRLAARCRRSGLPLLALTPLPPGRRPSGLGADMAVVTWDHGTGVREVVRAVRMAGAA